MSDLLFLYFLYETTSWGRGKCCRKSSLWSYSNISGDRSWDEEERAEDRWSSSQKKKRKLRLIFKLNKIVDYSSEYIGLHNNLI